MINFLFGRRRRGVFAADLVTLLINCSCFILRLSFFEAGNKDSCLLIVEGVVFLRIDLRGFAVRVGGALKDVRCISHSGIVRCHTIVCQEPALAITNLEGLLRHWKVMVRKFPNLQPKVPCASSVVSYR